MAATQNGCPDCEREFDREEFSFGLTGREHSREEALSTLCNCQCQHKCHYNAEKAAADDRRSLASLIDRLLEDYCREFGYLKPERRLGVAVEPERQRKAKRS